MLKRSVQDIAIAILNDYFYIIKILTTFSILIQFAKNLMS